MTDYSSGWKVIFPLIPPSHLERMEKGCVGTVSEDTLVLTQSLRSNWYNFCLFGLFFFSFFCETVE